MKIIKLFINSLKIPCLLARNDTSELFIYVYTHLDIVIYIYIYTHSDIIIYVYIITQNTFRHIGFLAKTSVL